MTTATVGKQEAVKHGICYMCTLRCPIKIHVNDGKATQIDIVNPKAAHCPRGQAQLDFVYHPDRLRYPLKRTGPRGSGSFQRISWDEALDTVAGKLTDIKAKYGAESVVFYVAYTKEPRPYFHRLAIAFGSPNYCTESSNCFSATWLAAALNYGQDYGWIYQQSRVHDPASKCKLVWGSAIEFSHPPLWYDHVEARKNGLKLIVVDPRRTTIASMADIHLQPRPGTDGALALGMMNVIINEGLYDKEFVEKWTVGFDGLKQLVQEYPPDRVEKITWVPASKIRDAAILYATNKPAKLGMSPQALVHSSNGVQNHRAVVLLPALTGNFEVPGGNRWLPDELPKKDITLHDRVANMPPGVGSQRFPIWTKMYKEMQSNVIADQIETGKPYPVKAIFGAGLNITFFPNSNRFVEQLKKLDFIAMTEYMHTPTTPYADVVLPIASWLERQILVPLNGGHTTLVEPAIEPVGESWPEWKIYSELAKRWGIGDVFWNGDFEKCVDYILQPSGITVEELKKHPEGMKYPVPPRPAKYYKEAGFETPSGKVEIASSILAEYGFEPLPVYKEPAESPISRPDLARSFPLVLNTGARAMPYVHSQYRTVARLRKLLPEPLVEINPKDAKVRGIKSDDMVTVSSPRGSIQLKADVTDAILSGVVHIPHQWPGEANVNILIDDQNLDPLSGFAPFKAQLCQVSKG